MVGIPLGYALISFFIYQGILDLHTALPSSDRKFALATSVVSADESKLGCP
jgi:hypothetical protein